MTAIRILLVDNHELVRLGVRSLLEQEEDMEIVGDFSSAGEALLQIETLSPNIILMEAKMPDISGIEATRRLQQKRTPCNIIMLTLHEDCLTEALEAGAAGYLLSDIKCQELTRAIRRVYHGELVIDERLTATPPAAEDKAEYPPAEGDGSENLIREAELIIPPPFDTARLLRFIYQVEETLEAIIVQEVGSWNKGTAITILMRRVTPLTVILNRLGKMPEVEDVRDTPRAKYKLSSFFNKTTTRAEPGYRKELLVTLKPAETANLFELPSYSS
ncbi:MAG: response regulator transcription factor [Chloroflexi bacterium]|nr:response regulator transcription factor [Chloroflexota bacterium]MBI3040818.1 response regulator transcription factor [Chloroflexota bacterium]MBI3931335.1 response regulator transcription factor [Chloroflexota bacterium]